MSLQQSPKNTLIIREKWVTKGEVAWRGVGEGGLVRGFCLSGGITLESNCICNRFQFSCHFGHLRFVYQGHLCLWRFHMFKQWYGCRCFGFLMCTICERMRLYKTDLQPALKGSQPWEKKTPELNLRPQRTRPNTQPVSCSPVPLTGLFTWKWGTDLKNIGL